MKKLILIFPFLGLLSACVPPMTREEQLSIYRSRCLDYGFLWGTPEFAKCMMDQEAQAERLAIERRKASAREEENRLKREKLMQGKPLEEDNKFFHRSKSKKKKRKRS